MAISSSNDKWSYIEKWYIVQKLLKVNIVKKDVSKDKIRNLHCKPFVVTKSAKL